MAAGKDSPHRFRKKQKNILAGDYNGEESGLVYLNSFTKVMLRQTRYKSMKNLNLIDLSSLTFTVFDISMLKKKERKTATTGLPYKSSRTYGK